MFLKGLAGLGLGKWRVETPVEKTFAAYLAGVQRRDCMLPAPQRGMTLQAKQKCLLFCDFMRAAEGKSRRAVYRDVRRPV